MTTSLAERSHSTKWVAHLAGVTYRQLDYWTRLGLLRPSIQAATGSGRSRRFSDLDVLVTMVVQRLMAHGLDHATIVDAVEATKLDPHGLLWVGTSVVRGDLLDARPALGSGAIVLVDLDRLREAINGG